MRRIVVVVVIAVLGAAFAQSSWSVGVGAGVAAGASPSVALRVETPGWPLDGLGAPPLALAWRGEVGYAIGAAAPSVAVLGVLSWVAPSWTAVRPYVAAGGGFGLAAGGLVPTAVVAAGARVWLWGPVGAFVEATGAVSEWGRGWGGALGVAFDLGGGRR
jgi:hypothetical protein